jgi:hypothetical protein
MCRFAVHLSKVDLELFQSVRYILDEMQIKSGSPTTKTSVYCKEVCLTLDPVEVEALTEG